MIYDPSHEDTYVALVGRGATCNGSPISVGKQQSLREAVICTGFPPNPDAFPKSLACAEKIGRKVRGLRMYGSAAISYAWVACGRLTGYSAYDIK